MNDEQAEAVERALSILEKHFHTAVIVTQPVPTMPEHAVHYVGSWHSVASLTQSAANAFTADSGEEWTE